MKKHYQKAEQFLEWNAKKLILNWDIKPNWLTSEFWYCRETTDSKEFILVDPKSKTKKHLFDHQRLANALTQKGLSCTANSLPFDTFDYDSTQSILTFALGQQQWQCDLNTYRCSYQTIKKTINPGELLSPDKTYSCFVDNNNLCVRSIDSNQIHVLTEDGELDYAYAKSPGSNRYPVTMSLVNEKQPPVAIWSSDGQKILTHKLDERNVKPLYLLQSVLSDQNVRPRLHSYRVPFVGDEHVPVAELYVFDINIGSKTRLQCDPLIIEFLSPLELGYVWWSEDNQKIYFLAGNRGMKQLSLCVADAISGEVKVLLTEKSPTYIEPSQLAFFPNCVSIAPKSGEFIWLSERDGWHHLYLYDAKGQLKNQITQGEWLVLEVLHLDAINRWVYFIGCGREADQDPYYRHLYRAHIDSNAIQLLTPENAEHHIIFSPCKKYFLDHCSRLDLPAKTVLKDSEGHFIMEIETANMDQLYELGWQPPERIKVKSSDGQTELYGVLYKPSNFDPTQAYPIIDDVYPGPSIINTPNTLTFDSTLNVLHWPGPWRCQAMAELGFLIVNIQPLGTAMRSRAFRESSYGRFEDGGLLDHISAIQQLAKQYKFIDLNRVGITGHSAGGYAVTRAMCKFPEFYKVGVAEASVIDLKSYHAFWGERYQGLIDAANYSDTDNCQYAKNLQGKLLLMTGDMDDNVHPSNTIRFIDALIKANKDFDFVLLPNRNHEYFYDPYPTRKRWDYFVKHLLGLEPPKEYLISAPEKK